MSLDFQHAYSVLPFALFTGRFLLCKESWSLSVWTGHPFKLSLGLVGVSVGLSGVALLSCPPD